MTRQTIVASRTARCAPLAVLALFAFGCGHAATGGPAAGSPSSSQATPTTVESQSAPPAEGAGPERPAPAAKAPPGIQVASLPIGGGLVDVPAGGQRCVTVSLLNTTPVPAGVSVAVTGVRFREGVFSESRSSHGCSGPPCLDSFAFTSDARTCGVRVTASGSAGSDDAMYLNGVVCPHQRQSSACSQYARDAGHGEIPLTIDPPDAADPDATPGASPDTNSG